MIHGERAPFITPIFRIEIEHMKAGILQYIETDSKDLNERFEAAIEKAIKEFDFDGQVAKVFNETISSAIKNYFSYGAGSEAIKQAVYDLLKPTIKQ